MLDAAISALSQMLSKPFRLVLFKTLGLTLALLGAIWALAHKLIASALVLPYPWATTILSFLSGVGLFIGLAFLVTPASFAVAGFFFDELAEEVEREIAPDEPPGRALPFGEATWLAVKFALVSLIVNLIALVLLLVPAVNAVAFLGANAYLLGRGYFELAAARFLPLTEVHRLRKANALYLFVAGLCIAALLAIPVVNLLTPLFAAAFMVRINKSLMPRRNDLVSAPGLRPNQTIRRSAN